MIRKFGGIGSIVLVLGALVLAAGPLTACDPAPTCTKTNFSGCTMQYMGGTSTNTITDYDANGNVIRSTTTTATDPPASKLRPYGGLYRVAYGTSGAPSAFGSRKEVYCHAANMAMPLFIPDVHVVTACVGIQWSWVGGIAIPEMFLSPFANHFPYSFGNYGFAYVSEIGSDWFDGPNFYQYIPGVWNSGYKAGAQEWAHWCPFGSSSFGCAGALVEQQEVFAHPDGSAYFNTYINF